VVALEQEEGPGGQVGGPPPGPRPGAVLRVPVQGRRSPSSSREGARRHRRDPSPRGRDEGQAPCSWGNCCCTAACGERVRAGRARGPTEVTEGCPTAFRHHLLGHAAHPRTEGCLHALSSNAPPASLYFIVGHGQAPCERTCLCSAGGAPRHPGKVLVVIGGPLAPGP
jgi:hypothetical protein